MLVLMQIPIEYVQKPLKKGEKASCSLCDGAFVVEEPSNYILDEPCKTMLINAWIKKSHTEIVEIKKMLGWRE